MLNIGQIEKTSLLFGNGSADSGNSSPKSEGTFGNVLKSAIESKQNVGRATYNDDKPANDVGGFRKRLAKGTDAVAGRAELPLTNNKFANPAEVKDDKDNQRQMALSELLSSILGLPITAADIKNVTFEFGENPSEGLGSLMGKLEELLGKESESLGLEAKKGTSSVQMYANIKEILGTDIDNAIKNLLDTEGFGELLKTIETNKMQALAAEVLDVNAKKTGDTSSNLAGAEPKTNQANMSAATPQTASIPSEIMGADQLIGIAPNNSNNNVQNALTPMADNSEISDELVLTPPLNKGEMTQEQGSARNIISQNMVGGEEILENIPNEAAKRGDLNETTKNLKTDNLLNEAKNQIVKEGVTKNIADFMNVEKNSAVQSNSEITGNALNKTMVETKTGPELKETLRTEAAAKLEIMQVKTEANSGDKSGKENGLELLKQQSAETSLDNADNNMDESGFQNYLKESAAPVKADDNQNIKEASQKFDLREPKDISRLIRTLESAAGKGESKLTVSLSPENLGRLEIRLTEIGGKLTARFFTDNEASHKLMISHSEVIRAQLAEKGIVVENMDFGFKDASSKQDNGEGKHSQKSGEGRKNGKNSDDDDDLEGIEVKTYAEKQAGNNAVYA